MKILTPVVSITLVLVSLASIGAKAIEPLSSAEFASHCSFYRDKPEGADGIFCVRYIQGFIDGAIATDERVALNVAAELKQSESFAERALRTRLGRQLKLYGFSYYAEICLGDPVPLAEVVDKVVGDLEQADFKPSVINARDLVYEILRKRYPC